jgi:hypothetical protein
MFVSFLRAKTSLGSRPAGHVAGNRGTATGEGQIMAKILYMVIERFKSADPVPVYRRFRERGRLAPEGLSYVSSWVNTNLERCYQLMETDDPRLLDQWIANWSDIVDFEVYPVITSAEAAERVAPRL